MECHKNDANSQKRSYKRIVANAASGCVKRNILHYHPRADAVVVLALFIYYVFAEFLDFMLEIYFATSSGVSY